MKSKKNQHTNDKNTFTQKRLLSFLYIDLFYEY